MSSVDIASISYTLEPIFVMGTDLSCTISKLSVMKVQKLKSVLSEAVVVPISKCD